ncbi:MAG: DUF2842 domain-containing protein [Alphaproteobacteria bacterium]|nr:DUF2842 domain-containing protein [Alphaproteobacteria bacterium]
MPPRVRKIIGSLTLVVWVLAYVYVAAVIGDMLAKTPWWVKLIYFPIAGLAWVLPLKPLLKWMHARDEPSESPDV